MQVEHPRSFAVIPPDPLPASSTHTVPTPGTLDPQWSNAMYDMYPEWGPSRHRESEDNAPALQSVQSGLDLRDHGGQRPDDN